MSVEHFTSNLCAEVKKPKMVTGRNANRSNEGNWTVSFCVVVSANTSLSTFGKKKTARTNDLVSNSEASVWREK